MLPSPPELVGAVHRVASSSPRPDYMVGVDHSTTTCLASPKRRRAPPTQPPTPKKQATAADPESWYTRWIVRSKPVWKAQREARLRTVGALPPCELAPRQNLCLGGDDTCPINRLPDELLLTVLALIPCARSYGNALKTCRRWWTVGSDRCVAQNFATEIQFLRYARQLVAPVVAGEEPCPSIVTALSFSRVGDELYGATADIVRIWDCGTDTSTAPWVASIEHSALVTSIDTTPKALVVGAVDGTIHCWDTDSNTIELLWAVKHDNEPVCCVDTHFDGSLLADQARDAFGLWRLPDPREGGPPTCVRTFAATPGSPGHNEPVRVLHVGASGLVYSGSYDSTIKVWSFDGKCVDTIFLNDAIPVAIASHKSGAIFVGTEDGNIHIFSPDQDLPQGEYHHHKTGRLKPRDTTVTCLATAAGFLLSGGDVGICVWRIVPKGLGVTLEVITQLRTAEPIAALAVNAMLGRCPLQIAVASGKNVRIFSV